MPFFDISIPAPFKAFVTSKAGAGTGTGIGTSSQEQAPRRKSWTKLGRSFAGVRKHQHDGRHHQRRHSIQELGEWATKRRGSLLPTVSERRGVDVDIVVEDGMADGGLPGAGLYRVPSYSSEGSDSDWTAVQSDGTMTPPSSISRTSSYKKDAFIYEEDSGSTLTLKPHNCEPAMVPEPEINPFPIKLVKKTMAPPDDDFAFIQQMLNAPQVFIPTDPFIYDGPISTAPPAVPQRRLTTLKDQ